jgi:hypothetical protein
MGKGAVLAMVVAALIVVPVGIFFVMKVSAENSEVRLRKQVEAQVKANETSFDTCWKIVQSQAGVAEKHKEAFKDIYQGLMAGRHYEKGGTFMKWITESNPNFDGKLYEKLMNSIEAQRMRFMRDQQKLVDLKREHDTMLEVWPSSMFVGDRDPVEITVVTSSKTEATFETGKEDNIDVFK